MKKLTCLFGLLVQLTFTSAFSQTITGKVTDDSKQPIAYANVMLYSLPDSAFVGGTVTNEQGDFSVKNNSGKQGFLKASFIGYKTAIQKAENGVSIILPSSGHQLSEVVVSGNQRIFKNENGAIVANVKNTALATLPSATEVIAQMPFVAENDGVFTVFGKGTPVIYINNRLVRNQEELNRLSPKDIKTIKVITMPGAEYDASVKSVIKITTERTVGEGISGSVYAMEGYSNVYSGRENAQLNYRKGMWDVFGTLAYQVQKRKADTQLNQYIDLQDSVINQKNHAHENMNGKVFNPELGINFNPNKKVSVGVKYDGTFVSRSSGMNNLLESKSPSVVQEYNESVHIGGNDYSHLVNGYFDGELSSKLHLNISTDFLKSKDETDQDTYLVSESADTILSVGIQRNSLFAVKDVFNYQLSGGNLSFGSEYSHTEVNQTYTISQADLGLSNSATKLKQNRGALFTSYQKQLGKYTLSGGLRYEHVNFDYYSNGEHMDGQSKNYDRLFPNLSLSYSDKELNLSVAYIRKVNYPTYNQLRSNVQYDSPFTYEGGNPNLVPALSHEFTMTAGWHKWQFMANYERNKNEIQKLFSQYENNPIILFRQENIPASEDMSLSASFNPTFGLWNPRFEMSVYNQWLHLEDAGNQYSHAGWEGKWGNAFSLKNGYVLRANLSYATSGNYSIVYLKKRWSADVSASKEMLQKS